MGVIYMEKNIKFFSFLIIIIIIFTKLNSIFLSSSLYSAWSIYEDISENSIDVLFLGNSRLFNTIQPKVINQTLGTNSFVLGIPNDSIQIMEIELQKILQTQSPNLIIIDKYSLELLPAAARNQIGPLFQKSNLFEKIKIMKLFNYDINGIFSLINKHSEIVRFPYKLFKNPKYSKGVEIIEDRGFFNLDSVFNDWNNRENYGVTITNRESNQKNLEAFDRFMQICQKNNIEVVIISTQTFSDPIYSQDYIYPINIENLSNKYDFQYIDLEKQFPLEWFNFSNPSHYSSSGSLNITLYLIENILSQKTEILNNNLLNNYKEISIKEINASVRKNNIISINIEPILDSNNINYLFICETLDGEIIFKEKNKKGVFITPELNSETYIIKITLDHKKIEFKYGFYFEIIIK